MTKNKYAQIDPIVTFELPKPVNLKANRKYVFIVNVDKMNFHIEHYWLFIFKNWLRRLIRNDKQ